jgi:hypothetical protein
MDEETYLISCRVHDFPNIAGSLIKPCSRCGESVYASLASLIAAGKAARLICTVCVNQDEEIMANLRQGNIQPPSHGQIREARKALKHGR